MAFDKNNNLPVSTKGTDFLGKSASMHGIGLSNVKHETAKYLGNMDIKIKKNEFIVTVLLQESIKMIVTSIGSGAACYSIDEAKDMNLSEYIRGKRCTMEITDEMFAHTRDLFEKAGVQEVTYPQYTKFAVIDTPSQAIEKEMAFVMDGFYTGRISEDEIKGFFLEYAHSMQARNESKILNLYESFLNISYERAVKVCFDEGKDIAEKEGVDTNKAIYYDADYYYQAEEIEHKSLQNSVKEK